MLIGSGDNGGTGRGADGRGIGAGQEGAAPAQGIEIRGGHWTGGLTGVEGLEVVVHEFPVGVTGVVRNDHDDIWFLSKNGGDEEK